MKKNLRLLCICLCLIISLNSISIVNADELSPSVNADSQKIIDPAKYDIHKITFSKSDKLIEDSNLDKKNTDEIKKLLNSQEEKNIKEAKAEVKKLKLEQLGYYGLEEAYLNELDSLLNDDAYLEDYAIYVPKTQNSSPDTIGTVYLSSYSDPVYYGSYDGFSFQAAFSVYNQSYRETTSDWSKINTWIDGLINFGMNFVTGYITIPLSALEIMFGSVTVYDGAWIDVTTSEEVTSRLILIQDKYMKATPDPSNYVAVLNDMSKIVSEYAVLYPNNPYFPPSYQGQEGPQEVPSTYFYNSTITMEHAYNYYITSYYIGGMYQDLVPRGSIQWR